MDGLDSDNIFGTASSFADFTQNLRPTKPSSAFGFENAGNKLQVRRYDSIFNAKGERVTVRSGSRLSLTKDRDDHSYESALVLTRFWARHGEDDYTELEIRSPHMKAAIKAIVPEHKDADIDLKHITLRDEPRCIFHYRNQLFDYGTALEPLSEAQHHISYLLEHMQQELSSEIFTFSLNVELSPGFPSLDFANLWMLFRPGEFVYFTDAAASTVGKCSRVAKFRSMTRRKSDHSWVYDKSWKLTLDCIDYDGEEFGHRSVYTRIRHFDGFRALSELTVLPLEFHPDQDGIRARLTARGKKFTAMHATLYLQYSGIAEVLGNDRNVTLFGEDDEFPLQATWVGH